MYYYGNPILRDAMKTNDKTNLLGDNQESKDENIAASIDKAQDLMNQALEEKDLHKATEILLSLVEKTLGLNEDQARQFVTNMIKKRNDELSSN